MQKSEKMSNTVRTYVRNIYSVYIAKDFTDSYNNVDVYVYTSHIFSIVIIIPEIFV